MLQFSPLSPSLSLPMSLSLSLYPSLSLSVSPAVCLSLSGLSLSPCLPLSLLQRLFSVNQVLISDMLTSSFPAHAVVSVHPACSMILVPQLVSGFCLRFKHFNSRTYECKIIRIKCKRHRVLNMEKKLCC